MYIYLALFCYLAVVLTAGVWSSRSVKSSSDFILGNRSMNYWLTAMSAHASDMSSWLFMGYPAVILTGGLFNAWTAVGLLVCMWLNWKLVAPKIRTMTEKLDCSTMSSFFEKKFNDTSGMLGILSAVFCMLFYSVYICAGLVSLGVLFENLFNLPYILGISLGAVIVLTYVTSGGYIAIAWLDLIQGLFLLGVILFVPTYLYFSDGATEAIFNQTFTQEKLRTLLPDFSGLTLLSIISLVLGWGLGYFGQPHIITKFMGIRNASEINKSKTVGMIWMIFALVGATFVGLLGTILGKSISDPQMVFVNLVQHAFHPFFVGLVLCAIIAATINVICSQILVLSSTIAEDIYKKVVKKKTSSEHLLQVSRWGVVGVTIVAFGIAFMNYKSIYELVLYAWSGLGAAFGPLLVFSLYSKNLNKYAAYVGILSGGAIAALWPLADGLLPVQINALVPAFIVSFILIYTVTKVASKKAVATTS